MILAGHTYDIDKTVGSSGTETNGMQLLQGSKVTPDQRTITSKPQNFNSKLPELEWNNITLDGTQSSGCLYTVSNNCGSMTVKGDTEILLTKDGLHLICGTDVRQLC